MHIIGLIIGMGCGAYLWWIQMSSLHDWLGGIGWVVGLLFTPAVPLFPLVYWAVEGWLPMEYIAVDAVGIAATAVAFAIYREKRGS